MVRDESGTRRFRRQGAAVHFADLERRRYPSQDDLPPLEIPSYTVSRLVRREPSPDGSPDAKRARMTGVKHYGGSSHSVAHRLKESGLKLQELNNKSGSSGLATFKTPYPVFPDRKQLTETQKSTVRLISQYLKNLGLRESVDSIVEETGCKIEHAHAAKLRRSVLAGNWDEALIILERSAPYIGQSYYDLAHQELITQKCLDLISKGQVVKAVRLLRTTMLRYRGNSEIQQLHRLVLLRDEQLQHNSAIKNYRSQDYRQKVSRSIETILPTSFMMPESRLENIIDQSVAYQIKSCHYHLDRNEETSHLSSHPDSILVDHSCDRSSRIHRAQWLDDQHYEVFCCEFSPNGRLLATASLSEHIRIYKVNRKTLTLTFMVELNHPRSRKEVTSLSWSSDSKFLAIAGGSNAQPVEICIFDVVAEKPHRLLRRVNNVAFTACAFAWGNYMLAVADENGHFQIHDVSEPSEKESEPKLCWEGYRIKQLKGIKNDGAVLGLDTHNRIRRYQWRPVKSDRTLLSESSTIKSFAVHKTERYVLVSTEVNMHLWDIENRTLVRSFVCPFNMYATIDATFGGSDHEYIATGTPQGRLMIYNINDTFPAFELNGHKDGVNAVTWHPKAPGLFVSVSKDETTQAWHMGCDPNGCCHQDEPLSESNLANKNSVKAEKGKKTLKKKRKERADKRSEVSAAGGGESMDVQLLTDEMPKKCRRKARKARKRERELKQDVLEATDNEVLSRTSKRLRKKDTMDKGNKLGHSSKSDDMMEIDEFVDSKHHRDKVLAMRSSSANPAKNGSEKTGS